MTAVDMIREGFGAWADRALGPEIYTTPIVFTLLFLFGFLTAAILKSFKMPKPSARDIPAPLSVEGRKIIDDANTARLFELEAEVAASKEALKRFTETLSTTFAHLSGGLAIFDADKSLFLFNPALSELLDLDPVWLAKRPSIADFIGMLREKRHLPEKKNFLEWRRLLTDLKDTGQQKSYDDEWVLPDGRVFRVTGRPHPRGAVAFLFEDISAHVATERQRRAEESLNQSILNGLTDAVAVVRASGMVTSTNTALHDLFGADFCEALATCGIADLPDNNLVFSDTTGFWPKLATHVASSKRRAPWEHLLTAGGDTRTLADVSTLPDGATLVVFKDGNRLDNTASSTTDGEPDSLHFGNLENMLRQREITLDHSGFDPSCVARENVIKVRRVLWYLVVSAANSCRKGGTIALTSCVEGQSTNFACGVSKADSDEGTRENIAGRLIQSLTTQHDSRNSWTYDVEVDPLAVSFKAQKQLKLSAL